MFLSLLCVWHHVRKWKLGGVLAFRAFALTSPGDAVFPGWATRGRSTSGLIRPCLRGRKTQTHTHTLTLSYLEVLHELFYQHLRSPGSSWMSSVGHELIQTCVQARVGRTASVRTSVSPCDFLFFLDIFIYLFFGSTVNVVSWIFIDSTSLLFNPLSGKCSLRHSH